MTDSTPTPAEIAWQHMDCVRQFLEDTVRTNSKDRDDWAEDVEIAINMLARPDLATPAAAEIAPEPAEFSKWFGSDSDGDDQKIGDLTPALRRAYRKQGWLAATQTRPATHAEVLADEPMTDRELQTLRNLGNEAERAADEIVSLRGCARDRREPATGEPGGEATRPEDPWRQAIDAALVSAGLDCLAPDADPAVAVTSLIENEVAMALDPAISERAQALIERGQASAPQVVEPMFRAQVAARKWQGLLAEGHTMQQIAFAGPKGAGTIDPWGKVLWQPAASAPSVQVVEPGDKQRHEARLAITKIREAYGERPICCGNMIPGKLGNYWQPPDPPSCCESPEDTVDSLLDTIVAALSATPAQPCGHPASMLLTSAESGEPLYCEACDDKSARRDAEQREQELQTELARVKAELAALAQASALPAAPTVVMARHEAAAADFEAWEAQFSQPAAQQPAVEPLTDEQIEQGRKAVFSTDNPFCPCDSKTMRKAVRWAEAVIRAQLASPTAQPAPDVVADARRLRGLLANRDWCNANFFGLKDADSIRAAIDAELPAEGPRT